MIGGRRFGQALMDRNGQVPQLSVMRASLAASRLRDSSPLAVRRGQKLSSGANGGLITLLVRSMLPNTAPVPTRRGRRVARSGRELPGGGQRKINNL